MKIKEKQSLPQTGFCNQLYIACFMNVKLYGDNAHYTRNIHSVTVLRPN